MESLRPIPQQRPRGLLGKPMRVRKEDEESLVKKENEELMAEALMSASLSAANEEYRKPRPSSPSKRNHIPTWEEVQKKRLSAAESFPMTPQPPLPPSLPSIPHSRIGSTKNLEVLASATTTTTTSSSSSPNPQYFVVQNVRYQVIKEVGRGGSSVVYCAMRCDETAELVALKHVLGADNVSQLRSEIKLLLSLRNVNQVVQHIGHEVNSKEGVLVMELGQTDISQCFAELMLNPETGKRDLLVNMNTIRYFFEGMVLAVRAIHSARIVHGDLKPANFVFVKGKIKLIDFGIAKSVQDDTINITRDGLAGTMNYIPPEALMENSQQQYKLSCKADVWSLGCILYFLVYGSPPFQDITPNGRKITAILNPHHEIKYPTQGVEDALLDCMKRCLQRDVEKRMSIETLLAHPFLANVSSSPHVSNEQAIARNARMACHQLVIEMAERTREIGNIVGRGGRTAVLSFATEVMESLARSPNIAQALNTVLVRHAPMQDKENIGRSTAGKPL